MTDLPETSHASALVPYERGLPFSSVVIGTLGRFLPGSAGIISTVTLLELISDPSRWPILLGLVGLEVAGLTVGFGIGLEGLRRWLYPDAGVEGRRSIVAGLCSPLALAIVSVFSQGAHLSDIAIFSTLAGTTMALLMYFAWLSPTPEEKREPLPGHPGRSAEGRGLLPKSAS
jgi:hypothetical protein